ncbi:MULTISPECIES: hypothetical protein [Gordonia]|uniref:hypothetical protein n=1 Tax=Gordonia TaxID=2053 RepID=UPI0033912B8B
MSDKWSLKVNGTRDVIWGKNFLPESLLKLFFEHEKVLDQQFATILEKDDDTLTDDEWAYIESASSPRFAYSTRVASLLERLRFLGFTPFSSRHTMASVLGSDEPNKTHGPFSVDGVTKNLSHLEFVNYALAQCIAYKRVGATLEPDVEDFLDWEYTEAHESKDYNFLLAAILSEFDGNDECVLILDDLLSSGLVDPWRGSAFPNATGDLSAPESLPIIVVCEGKFDANILPRVLNLLIPDLAPYFRFWDMEGSKTAGGTDQVSKAVRAFAAAGIRNPVIAIFDNDAAGNVAQQRLIDAGQQGLIPDYYHCLTLPNLDYLREFPTLGPTGLSNADINGRGASLEFYFGTSTLRDDAGELIRAVWSSQVGKNGPWQASLPTSDKDVVQTRIRTLLAEAEGGGHLDPTVWGPLREFAEQLVSTLQSPPDFPDEAVPS